jgi:hypothetical protein
MKVRSAPVGQQMTTSAEISQHPTASTFHSLLNMIALVTLIATSAGISCWLVGIGVAHVSTNKLAPWIVGRAAGTTAYLLLDSVVILGLILSHPWRSRVRRPGAAARIRLHVSLSAFTCAFVILHVVVLATDSYAGVGWRGSVLPFGATYRPAAVTLGVIGTYAGLIAGLTAATAGRIGARIWWPIHKVSSVALILVWLHGVLAGSDSKTLLSLYLVTGFLTVVVALTRYGARTPADRVAELVKEYE